MFWQRSLHNHVHDHRDALFNVTVWALQWRYNERDGVSDHPPHDCLLNRLLRRRSKETSKLRVTGRCAGNSPVAGKFPAQRFPFDDVIMSKFDHIITSHHIITSITSIESVQLYVHSSWNGGMCWFRKNLTAYSVHTHFLNKHRVIRSKATDRTILSREIIAKVSVFYK